MTQQTANLLIAVIISVTVLYGFGAFTQKEMSYATVNFYGGFKKIGEIAEQRAFSQIEISAGDERLYSGEISDVVEEINRTLEGKSDKNKLIWNDGIRISGNVGIRWVGSESNFDLTIDTIDFVSTENNPILIVDMIAKLEALDADIKENHNEYAKKSLTFSEKPDSSFLLSKLISAFSS